MRIRRKVFVVTEDHPHKDSHKIFALFATFDEADKCVCARGEVLTRHSFQRDQIPFDAVFMLVKLQKDDYGVKFARYWIEEHEIELPAPRPKLWGEGVTFFLGGAMILTGGATGSHSLFNTALVLTGCVLVLYGFVSALIKS